MSISKARKFRKSSALAFVVILRRVTVTFWYSLVYILLYWRNFLSESNVWWLGMLIKSSNRAEGVGFILLFIFISLLRNYLSGKVGAQTRNGSLKLNADRLQLRKPIEVTKFPTTLCQFAPFLWIAEQNCIRLSIRPGTAFAKFPAVSSLADLLNVYHEQSLKLDGWLLK
jgi:hypothetical protein